MHIPSTIGTVHFVGIGGIGMSGIAEVLHSIGYQVQGSDQAEGANVERLRARGIKVYIGHRAENLGDAEVVVASSAIKQDNPERIAAGERRIPLVRRAEMLAELMRFKNAIAIGGTHGKTTTTSMVGTLLEAGDLDPTVINGGIINHLGTNVRLGEGDWMVCEADESDGTFLKLPADVAVVTNIDPEHLDHYGDYEAVKAAFREFVENVPFYGFGVCCIDHPEVQAMVSQITDRRIITYGENKQADVRFSNISFSGAKSRFDVDIWDWKTGEVETISGLELPMAGIHNVSNATAAIAVASQLGVDAAGIAKGISAFSGVKRRFTPTGEWNGVNIFDDYAHHPVEISAVLSAARGATQRRVITVMQPHRFSRLHSLFGDFCSCFNDADSVLVAPVYTAGEAPIPGADEEALVNGLKAAGHRDPRTISRPGDIAPIIAELAEPGDLVIFLGAGDITKWAYALPGELAALDKQAGSDD